MLFANVEMLLLATRFSVAHGASGCAGQALCHRRSIHVVEAFKRNSGMKYVQEARAPDGRTGDYESFAAREGNPYSLLEDDEQDAISRILEGR